MLTILTHARRTERGATAVEYGLLIAGIAGVIALAFLTLGDQVLVLFQDTCSSVAATAKRAC